MLVTEHLVDGEEFLYDCLKWSATVQQCVYAHFGDLWFTVLWHCACTSCDDEHLGYEN